MDTFTSFILGHAGDDPARLLLSRDRWDGIDIDLAVNTIQARSRLARKLPSWHAVPSLTYPLPLAAEQCSSEETALHKASVAISLFAGQDVSVPAEDCLRRTLSTHGQNGRGPMEEGTAGSDRQREGRSEQSERRVRGDHPCGKSLRIADLTGGMGVDSWAFAKAGAKVLYNEADGKLADAARHNFKELGHSDIAVSNRKVGQGNVTDILDGFSPDMIYLDPARRGDGGKRVFALEECSPDLVAMKEELLGNARFVMAKISPMADISRTVSLLGPHVREVHAVSSGGECKEILVILDREYSGEPEIVAWQNGNGLRFTMEEERRSPAVFPEAGRLSADSYPFLFRPGASLTKAGAFNLICSRFGLVKLAPSTHLYFCGSPVGELEGLGKFHRISGITEMTGKTVRETGKSHPRAEVTAKNIGMDGDTLRKKLGCTGGGNTRIFGARIEPSRGKAGKYLIIA